MLQHGVTLFTSTLRPITHTLLLLFLPYIISAQTGFSKTMLYPDAKSCTIAAVTIDQDTIVCYGTLFGTSEQKWGVYLAKFDSSGNFLQITTDFDSLYEQTVNPFSQILRTSDGGYIGVGSQGIGIKTAAYKFSHTGKLEWRHFYREDNFQVVLTNSIQELADGYLCFGRYAVNNDNSTFTMKLSRTGELIWFSKAIGVIGYNDTGFCSSIKKGANYVMGSNLSAINSGIIDTPNYWCQSRLAEVDSLGNIVREWYSQNLDKELSAISLICTPNQDIVYTAIRYFKNALNGYDCKMMVRRVDTQNSNTIWLKEIPSVDLTLQSGLSHLLTTPDGSGFDAVGIKQKSYDGFVMSGVLAHFDWDGNLKWQRYDTVHIDTVLLVSENKLYNMAHLSSGAIIGVGQIKRGDPYSHLEGWLIKWSPNGCLQPSDCATVGTHESPSGDNKSGWKQWEVYPNPASDYTWLYQPDDLIFNKSVIQISNTTGQVIQEQVFDYDASGLYKVSLTGMASGLYFYQLMVDGKVHKAGRFVVL